MIFNPLERLLRKAQRRRWHRFLILWNRGLGDIALGLYAITTRIRETVPDAEITFLTRPDLEEGFQLLDGVKIMIDPKAQRGTPLTLPLDLASFDCIIERADPTKWVAWQRGRLTPRLTWNPTWDSLHTKFSLPEKAIGVHIATETNYYHARNWPLSHWKTLFHTCPRPFILFGHHTSPLGLEAISHIIDLRGKTSLFEMLSILKHRCDTLIAPDSGVLAMTYFLDTPFPLKVISLWADPNHGVLKQNVASPNPLLVHTPLISPNRKEASLIRPEEVLAQC
jgi:ADP-heptose:LPS heptosyltransferase